MILFWFLIHTTTVIAEGFREDKSYADVGVIFGTKNRPNGTLSIAMERRLNVGLRLYSEGRVQKLIVSGGRAYKGFCEGDLMLEYLVKHGVPLAAIIVDNEARNTEENVVNSLKIVKDNDFRKIIIISQYYHISRIRLMYYKKGFYNIGSASSHYINLEYHPQMLIREFIGYYYYYFFK